MTRLNKFQLAVARIGANVYILLAAYNYADDMAFIKFMLIACVLLLIGRYIKDDMR